MIARPWRMLWRWRIKNPAIDFRRFLIKSLRGAPVDNGAGEMERHCLFSRLRALNARLDEILFYEPNAAAVGAVTRTIGGNRKLGAGAFRKVFRSARQRLPKASEDLVRTHVAVQDHTGKIMHGPTHALIGADLAQQLGGGEVGWKRVEKVWPTLKKGFVTTRQPFVSRGEAKAIAAKQGIRPKPAAWRREAAKGLHSSDLRQSPPR